MANPEPTYDGIEVSWTDLRTTVLVGGTEVHIPIDYSAISFESLREIGATYARGRLRKRTSGKVTDSASMTFWTSGCDEALKVLDRVARQLGHVNGNTSEVGKVACTIIMKFFFPASNILHERHVYGARLGKLALAASEGNDAQTEDVDLSVAQIKYIIDGKEVGI